MQIRNTLSSIDGTSCITEPLKLHRLTTFNITTIHIQAFKHIKFVSSPKLTMVFSVIWCVELTAERITIDLKWLKLSRQGHTAMPWWHSGSRNTYYIRFICLCPCIIITQGIWSWISESRMHGRELKRINYFYISPSANVPGFALLFQCSTEVHYKGLWRRITLIW